MAASKPHVSHDHEHRQSDRTGHNHQQHHHHHKDSACCDTSCATPLSKDDAPSVGDSIWKVEGMDCASCAATITTALQRLPGTSNVHVSLIRERLSLTLDETQTPRDRVEKTVAALGYKAYAQQPGNRHEEENERPWWQTSKGKAAIFAGAMLATGFFTSWLKPQWSFVAFGIAGLLALFPVALRAFAAFKNGSPFTIEMLMTIAAIGAIFINATEEATVVVFLFCVGELLEGVAAGRARSGIKALGKLTPKTAWRENNGELTEVPAGELQIGDTILVRPGDRIAADGSVIDGISSVNEASITGESVPLLKEIGDAVYAGSINTEAALRIRVEKNAHDNTIARIIELVETAQDAKAPTQRFIDNFARIYMPVIVAIAILTAFIPPLLAGADWTTWIYRALALLLIGCPCALVISVPAAIASSLAAGTRRGLLIKGGQVLEILAKVTTITFDKTGTLTIGQPAVTDIVALGCNSEETLAIAAALERETSHPLGQAIVKQAADLNLTPKSASDVHAIAGKGIAGKIAGKPVFIGAPRFAREHAFLDATAMSTITKLENEGKTVVIIVIDKTVAGIIGLRDEPRQDAKDAIASLKNLGLKSVMLTGDNHRTAAAIAQNLGVEAEAELLPEMKVDAINKLRGGGSIAMVGDGINDAPALATADVGIAMGSGTDVALETADTAILRNRIADVPILIRLARATMNNIRQNVTIALGLKLIFLITTIFGVTGLWFAVFADTGATMLVTLNALRLLAFNSGKS